MLEKRSGLIWPFLIGVLLGAPFAGDLRFDASPPVVWYLLLVQLLVGMMLSARKEVALDRYRLTAALTAGTLVGVAALAMRLLLADPLNNMWPLAFVLYGLLSALAIAIGVILGAAARRFLRDFHQGAQTH